MAIAILILLPLLWLAFAVYAGAEEAIIYTYRDSEDPAYAKDWHKFYTGFRLLVFAMLALLLVSWFTWYYIGLYAVFCVLVFPYMHDGTYYVMRRRISGAYSNGWRTNGNTSTARISIQKHTTRLWLFIAGLAAYILFIFLTLKLYNYV